MLYPGEQVNDHSYSYCVNIQEEQKRNVKETSPQLNSSFSNEAIIIKRIKICFLRKDNSVYRKLQ